MIETRRLIPCHWRATPAVSQRWMTSGLMVSIGIMLLLPACAAPGLRCAPELGHPMLVVELFFGRAVTGRGDVTETEWQDFQARTITPNLPNGYTAHDATGAWMSPVSHMTIHENTKVLTVAIPDNRESLAAIERIRSAYQLRFRQQLVGMTVYPACGSF